MPGLWHGGPSASACLGDKGARWAGSTRAWLRQGRGWQERAPSGLKTQAQHGCPPTCSRCAQTPPQLDGSSCEVWQGWGGEASRRGKGGLLGLCGPHALPEVQPRALDPGSRIPWSHSWPRALAAARDCSGQGGSQLLGKGGVEGKKGKGKERNPLQHTREAREGNRGALIPKKGVRWGTL